MTLQDQLNARGRIDLPPGETIVHQPLVIRGGTHLDGCGMHTIKCSYDGPIFETPLDESAVNWSIRRLTLMGGGIRLPPSTGLHPSFFAIEDLFISAASIAFNDDYSGAWMGTVSRVFAANCAVGFRKRGGTTMVFTSCHAAGGDVAAWDFFATYGVELHACAMDDYRAQVGAPAATFRDCRGLSLTGWYMEQNHSDGGPVMAFERCDGLHLAAFTSLFSGLHAPPAGAAYLLLLADCRGVLQGVSVGGADRATPDVADGAPTGHTASIILTGANRLAFDGCTIAPARKTVVQQTGFSLIGPLETVRLDVTTRLFPGLGPGVVDPYV